jgi:hypothetical protein
MPLGPGIGALIAWCVKSVMPVMTPNSDFNAKFVNVRVMMMLLSFAFAVAFGWTMRRRRCSLYPQNVLHGLPANDRWMACTSTEWGLFIFEWGLFIFVNFSVHLHELPPHDSRW